MESSGVTVNLSTASGGIETAISLFKSSAY